jgi:hypothetical protein
MLCGAIFWPAIREAFARTFGVLNVEEAAARFGGFQGGEYCSRERIKRFGNAGPWHRRVRCDLCQDNGRRHSHISAPRIADVPVALEKLKGNHCGGFLTIDSRMGGHFLHLGSVHHNQAIARPNALAVRFGKVDVSGRAIVEVLAERPAVHQQPLVERRRLLRLGVKDMAAARV